MAAVARQSDICSGHDCFPPQTNTSWSGDVIVNGLGWHREGDGWVVHVCGNSQHNRTLTKGSSTVYVNGKQAGRIGDPIGVNCGSCIARGSQDVYAGCG